MFVSVPCWQNVAFLNLCRGLLQYYSSTLIVLGYEFDMRNALQYQHTCLLTFISLYICSNPIHNYTHLHTQPTHSTVKFLNQNGRGRKSKKRTRSRRRNQTPSLRRSPRRSRHQLRGQLRRQEPAHHRRVQHRRTPQSSPQGWIRGYGHVLCEEG